MRAIVWTFAVSAGAMGVGQARAADVERHVTASAAALVGAFDPDSEAESFVGRAEIGADANVLFDNQIEIGGGIGLVGERDNPLRSPRGGRAGDCPPSVAACPGAAFGGVRGFVSGFSPSGRVYDVGPRANLETAYVYVRNGWGEASVGREDGAAARFGARPPSVLAVGGGLDPALDPAGLGGVYLKNDVSGRSLKAELSSTALLGFSVAASFTPTLENEGLDQGFRDDPSGPLTYAPENIVEAAASFDHTFQNGLSVQVAATASRAEPGRAPAAFDDMNAYGAGATVGKGPFKLGLAYHRNDNGWRAGNAAYEAYGGSATYERDDWAIGLDAGAARDGLVKTNVAVADLAVRKSLSPEAEVAIGAQWRGRNSPQALGVAVGRSHEETKGIFVVLAYRR